MLLKTEKRINQVLVCILGLCLYYYCYRYILQYNAETTSPTYSDTPDSIKLYKYILLAVLVLYLFAIIISSKSKRFISNHSFGTCFLLVLWSLLLIVNAIIFDDYDSVKVVIGYLVPIALIAGGRINIDMETMEKFMLSFFYFSVAYEVIQVLLFFTIGRLPALAYENSISVRFGGPWDDPNGWGIFLSFFFPFIFFKIKERKRRYILLSCCLAMLGLTQSGTALLAIFASCSIFILTYKRKPFYKIFGFVLLIAIGVIIIYYILNSIEYYKELLELKSASIDGHKDSYDYLSKMDMFEFVFGLHNFSGESSIVEIISKWGVFYLFLTIYIMYRNIDLIKRRLMHNTSPFWAGALTYQIAFVVAMANIPVFRIFYMALFSAIIIGLSEINNYNNTEIQ